MKALLIPIFTLFITSHSIADEPFFRFDEPANDIYSLGSISYHIDLSMNGSGLLDLKLRDQDIRFPNGEKYTAYTVSSDANLVVLAKNSISSVQIITKDENKLGIIFRDGNGDISAPIKDDIYILNAGLVPQPFYYEPLVTPDSINVSLRLFIDNSGSMAPYLDDAIMGTSEFLKALPDFIECDIYSFNDTVVHLNIHQTGGSCEQLGGGLNLTLKPGGGTALLSALDLAFEPEDDVTTIISVFISDGINTVTSTTSLALLRDKKNQNNAKLFMLWAGPQIRSPAVTLADLEIDIKADFRREIKNFFDKLGVSITGMQQITLK